MIAQNKRDSKFCMYCNKKIDGLYYPILEDLDDGSTKRGYCCEICEKLKNHV